MNCTYGPKQDLDTFRSDEILYSIIIDENGTENFKAAIDYTFFVKINSVLNISRTIFVCIVLTLAAHFFMKDINDKIMTPIEKMITKVNKIAEDPLSIVNEKISFEQTQKV